MPARAHLNRRHTLPTDCKTVCGYPRPIRQRIANTSRSRLKPKSRHSRSTHRPRLPNLKSKVIHNNVNIIFFPRRRGFSQNSNSWLRWKVIPVTEKHTHFFPYPSVPPYTFGDSFAALAELKKKSKKKKRKNSK